MSRRIRTRIRARIGSLLLALVVAEGAPVVMLSQTTVRVGGAATCTRCRIEMRPVATLTDSLFDIDAFSTRVFRDPNGRYLVTGERGSSLGLFSASGAFVRLVGRRGAGPGEFQQINWVTFGPDGTLEVFDFFLKRRSVFDGASLRFLATHSSPPINEALWTRDGRMLASASIANGAVGSPLHLVLPDGRIERSFGAAEARGHAGDARAQYRVLERARTGFIVLPLTSYRVEYWSARLELTRTITREVPWFTDSAGAAAVGHPDTHRPPPMLRGATEDSDGRLWTNVGVPDAGWRPKRGARAGERPVILQRTVGELYDTIFEIIDVSAGRLVHTQRLDGMIAPIPGSDLYWRFKDDPERGTSIEILKAVLVR